MMIWGQWAEDAAESQYISPSDGSLKLPSLAGQKPGWILLSGQAERLAPITDGRIRLMSSRYDLQS